MWWKFRRHKLAMAGLVIVILLYLIAIFAEMICDPRSQPRSTRAYTYAPPQRLGLVREKDGERVFGLFRLRLQIRDRHRDDGAHVHDRRGTGRPGRVLGQGFEYNLFGFIPMDRHLIGPKDPTQPFYILGADRLGQDLFSRLIIGTRISMSIGLIGVFLSLILGIIIGGISGYFGGGIDTAIQRLIEFLQSIPTIPLWLGLAAAVPAELVRRCRSTSASPSFSP